MKKIVKYSASAESKGNGKALESKIKNEGRKDLIKKG